MLITPGSDGNVTVPPGGGDFPAACYVEQPISTETPVRFLGDIWMDTDRALTVARDSVLLSHRLARRAIETISGANDDTLLPLTLDVANHVVEVVLERSLRLADVRRRGSDLAPCPARLRHALALPETGGQFKALQKPQSFQWLVLRLLCGAPDRIRWTGLSAASRLRRRSALARIIGQSARQHHDGWYAAGLGRHAGSLNEIGVRFAAPPQLVQQYVLRRDRRVRKRLATSFLEMMEPVLERLGAPTHGLGAVAELYAALFPVSRVEALGENVARYDSWASQSRIAGFITAVGHSKQDANVFLMAACNRRRLPVVVVQHGGQYGYDDKIPGFVTSDIGLATHFASWGWEAVPSSYGREFQRAAIVPMPDPRMSEIAGRREARRAADGPRTLLVPLSKFRTLDNRLGGNATDGNLLALRMVAHDVILRCRDKFERIVVTYRGHRFDTDPLAPMLAAAKDPRIQVMSAAEAPAFKLFGEADAVFWDVTATGLFESLAFGLPSVALFRSGRWARDAAWAENLMHQCGVAAYSADEAVDAIARFTTVAEAWRSARSSIQPVLDRFAHSHPDWRDIWRNFLCDLGGNRRSQPSGAAQLADIAV